MRAIFFFLLSLVTPLLSAQAITRAEVLAIAQSYAEYQWEGTAANTRHAVDRQGIVIQTPSAPTPQEAPTGYWVINQVNTGVPYKWGGFDTLETFTRGLKAGKAAGDLYNAQKRLKADAAVSSEAVGVDCSGFISRCWKLPKKYGTATLPELCLSLKTPRELKPGDIMNSAGGHVLLFSCWLDASYDRAQFYEAHPFSKVLASEYSTTEMQTEGFKPYRLRSMRD